jgi:hypothetical protein
MKEVTVLGLSLTMWWILCASAKASNYDKDVKSASFKEIPFQWAPEGHKPPYRMPVALDQHRIFLHPEIEKGGQYPVVVGFHGQPKRGKNPRDYKFLKAVRKTVADMVQRGLLKPFVLVLPVFRFYGQNWPGFDLLPFRKTIEERLAKLDIQGGDWYAFGHSGAAGCGGDGLNRAHRLEPKKVGFFDTCLGTGWQKEIGILKKRQIGTINIHSVETAGFRPRQRPEYQASFDFGRAYRPLGLRPIPCQKTYPGARLRDQPYRCAATEDGVIKGFVVDTGEGVEAHEAVLAVALRYFLMQEVGLAR